MPRGKRATAPTENDDTDAGLPVRPRLAAGSIPPPATTGAASVFALAKSQPKPRRKQAPSNVGSNDQLGAAVDKRGNDGKVSALRRR